MSREHHYSDLITLFDSCFSDDYQTRLVKGEDEPIYLPADEKFSWNRICFAHGFYASALHEIAHWCVAGAKRRKQIDFGYWYCPDGRDTATQKRFEMVEIKPQALEWMFCVAAGFPFNVSCDNLEGDAEPDYRAFQRAVYAQVRHYFDQGIPERPARFIAKLQQFYATDPLSTSHFLLPASSDGQV